MLADVGVQHHVQQLRCAVVLDETVDGELGDRPPARVTRHEGRVCRTREGRGHAPDLLDVEGRRLLGGRHELDAGGEDAHGLVEGGREGWYGGWHVEQTGAEGGSVQLLRRLHLEQQTHGSSLSLS